MDMSVNPDGMDTVDYSDFEYQQIYHQHAHRDLTGSPAQSIVKSDYGVLEGIGGLDNNEVAELAYAEIQVNIEHFQDRDDQDVGSQSQVTGIVGANLPATDDLLPSTGTAPQTDVVSETNVEASNTGSQDSEDRVFAPFVNQKAPSFDDQTNGPGGSGGQSTLVIERPFRQLVGRGPVLDSSDDMSVLTEFEQKDEIIDADANVHVHCVWDVAEVSDAGRAFSVPK